MADKSGHMNGYLTGLNGVSVRPSHDGGKELAVSEMASAGLCPLLYHNLVPYIMTLSGGVPVDTEEARWREEDAEEGRLRQEVRQQLLP